MFLCLLVTEDSRVQISHALISNDTGKIGEGASSRTRSENVPDAKRLRIPQVYDAFFTGEKGFRIIECVISDAFEDGQYQGLWYQSLPLQEESAISSAVMSDDPFRLLCASCCLD